MNKKENEKLCAVVFDMMTMLIGTMLNEKRLLYTCIQKSEFFSSFLSSALISNSNPHQYTLNIYHSLSIYSNDRWERIESKFEKITNHIQFFRCFFFFFSVLLLFFFVFLFRNKSHGKKEFTPFLQHFFFISPNYSVRRSCYLRKCAISKKNISFLFFVVCLNLLMFWMQLFLLLIFLCEFWNFSLVWLVLSRLVATRQSSLDTLSTLYHWQYNGRVWREKKQLSFNLANCTPFIRLEFNIIWRVHAENERVEWAI